MTDALIFLFFGAGLVIMVVFAFLMLRREIAGRPKADPDSYDFGLNASRTETKIQS